VKLRKRKVLAVVIALFLFIVTIFLLLHAPFLRTRVLQYTVNFFEQKKGIILNARSLNYNLFKLKFTLKEVEIKDSREANMLPFFQADEVKIKIPIALLFGNKLQIQELDIKNPKIAVCIDKEGKNNVPFKTQSMAKSSGIMEIPEFVLNRARVQNGWIHYKDERRSAEYDLPGLSLGIRWMGKGCHSFYLGMEREGSAVYQGLRSSVDMLELKAELDYEGIDVQEFRLQLAQNRLEFKGRVELFSSSYIKGILQGELDLEDIHSLFQVDNSISGRLNFYSRLEGPLFALDGRIQIEGKDLRFEELENISLDADVRLKNKFLHLQSLDMNLAGGKIYGQGKYHLWEECANNNMNVEWKSIDLRNFHFVHDRFLPLASATSGFAQIFWSDFSLQAVSGQAEIRLLAQNRRDSREVPLSGRVLAEFNSGRMTVSTKNLSVPGARIMGRFRLSPDLIRGRFTLEADELSTLSSLIMSSSQNAHKKSRGVLNVGGELSLSGNLEGTLKSPSISAELRSTNLSIHDWKGLKLDGILIYDSHLLRLQPLCIHDGEERVEIAGFYSLKPSHHPMRFDISGREISSERVPKAFQSDIPAKGKINLEARIKGTPADPNVEATLLLEDVSFYQQDFKKVKIRGKYGKENIFLESLEAKKSEGKIEAEGWYSIDDSAYDLNLSVDSLPLQDFPFPGFEERVSAVVDLQLQGKGKVDAPQIDTRGLLKGLTVGEKEIGDIRFQTKSLDEALNFQITAPLYSSGLAGILGLSPPYPLNADLRINNLSFKELGNRILFGEEIRISGSLRGEVKVRGDLARWGETMNLKAHFEELELRTPQHQIRNEGPIIISYGRSGLELENLKLGGRGMSVHAHGKLPLNSSSASGLSFDVNVDLGFLSSFFGSLDALGMLKIKSNLSGTFSDLEMTAGIDLFGAKIVWAQFPVPIEDMGMRFDISKNMMKIESISFRMGKSQCQITGDVPLESLPLSLPGTFHVFGKREANLSMFIQDLDPFLMKTFMPSEILEQLSGKIDGKIVVTGGHLRWNEITAEAYFDSLELDLWGIPLAQEDSSHLVLEKGKLSFHRFDLLGEESRLEIRGSVDLGETESINMFFSGDLELKILSAFIPNALFSGSSDFQVQLRENYSDPLIEGFIGIKDFGMQMTYPLVLISQVNGKIKIRKEGFEIEQIQGGLNGGKLSLEGEIGFRHLSVTGADVMITSENSLFDYPKDLRSQISCDLRLKSDGKDHFLAGRINMVNAKYTEPFGLESAILRYLRRGRRTEGLKEPNPFLSNLRFDMAINTLNALIIDNNISKSEVRADLRLTGTIYQPALAGRIEFSEGGQIYFSHNTFYIERGTVDFINPSRIEPDVNLTARTQVYEYDIQLILTGTPDKFSANFTSDPFLSEPNIISLLVTGRTLESASASVLDIAGSKALSYINSAVTGRIEKGLARSLGLESVRIDASLVSTEENPGARITVGQHIGRSFEVVLSQDLKDAQNRTWILNYNPNRKVNLQGVKSDDNEYNFSLRHELLFGRAERPMKALASPLAGKDLPVGSIELEGRLGLSEPEIRRKIKLAEGKPFDFYRYQESIDQIRTLYRRNHYLSYNLASSKEAREGQLNVIFRIDSGPKVYLRYFGAKIPKRIRKDIIDMWIGTSFGPLVTEDIKHRLRLHLLKKKYYQATIEAYEESSREGERLIAFQIHKGLKYKEADMKLEGNRLLSESRLLSFLKKNHLVNSVFVDPQQVRKSLEDFYAQNGFLRARAFLSKIQFDRERKTVHIQFQIEEGASFKIGELRVNRSQFFGPERLIGETGIRQGDSVSLDKFEEAAYRIKEIYKRKGFNDVRVTSTIKIDKEEGVVDLVFDIEENQQAIIGAIQISGNSITRKKVILRELSFKEGDEVNFRSINETRKSLYDLGIFERVSIELVPLSQAQGRSSQRDEIQTDAIKLYCAEIDVVEFRPYRLRYGLQYDTESSFGGSSNLINRNFLGRAQLLGTSFRLNRDERDLRAFLRSPYFFSKRINTEFYTFINRSIKPSFTVDRLGFTFQQQVEFKRGFILSYNYTFERNHTFGRGVEETPGSGEKINVCTLNIGLMRDTRDNILNPSRGMFFSQNIGYAPKLLGSDVRFIRYFGQYYAFRKISDLLVYAFGIRIGLIRGWDEDIIPSERFFAGGGTTIRGFGKNEVGPKHPETGLAAGGEAVFIFNQELRLPIYKKLSGVLFADVGNVYSKVSGFDPFEVREVVGFGLRYQTPFALLRFDWGFKLDRHPGETLSEIFFSIGQAF
jgi:outer membrane protein assembly complex protein YaeT